MDIGAGVALAGTGAGFFISAAAIIVTVVKTKAQGKSDDKHVGSNSICDFHRETMSDIWNAVNEIRQDIKELIKKH